MRSRLEAKSFKAKVMGEFYDQIRELQSTGKPNYHFVQKQKEITERRGIISNPTDA